MRTIYLLTYLSALLGVTPSLEVLPTPTPEPIAYQQLEVYSNVFHPVAVESDSYQPAVVYSNVFHPVAAEPLVQATYTAAPVTYSSPVPLYLSEQEINQRFTGLLFHVRWLLMQPQLTSIQNNSNGDLVDEVDLLRRQIFSYMDDVPDDLSNLSDNLTDDIADSSLSLTESGTFNNSTHTGITYINGMLGIGTSSPSDVLAVNGAIYLSDIIPASSISRLYNSDGDLYWNGSLVAGGSVGSWTLSGSDVTWTSGNVGIGTTSPYATLSVEGTSVLGTITSGIWNGTALTSPYINFGTGPGQVSATNIPITDTSGYYGGVNPNVNELFQQIGLEVSERWSSGVVSGGVITSAGGNTVDITSGIGYIGSNRITWNSSSGVAMTANGDNWISIDSTGSIRIDNTEPSIDNFIRLGYVYTIAGNTNIGLAATTPSYAGNYESRNNNFVSNAIGAIVVSGNIVGTTGTPLNIQAIGGTINFNLKGFVMSDTSTFTKWYRSADNGWVTDTADNLVNTTQYNDTANNQASALPTMTAGYWKKDLILRTLDGNLHYIYAQAEFATEQAAKDSALPSIPMAITNGGSVYLATAVVQNGDVALAGRLYDIRPNLARVFGFGTSGTTGSIATHAALSGLTADDHPQYLLTNGARLMTGNLQLNNNAITGVTSLTAGGLLQTTATTEQLRLRYDTSNYASFTVASTGALTIGTTGTGITTLTNGVNVAAGNGYFIGGLSVLSGSTSGGNIGFGNTRTSSGITMGISNTSSGNAASAVGYQNTASGFVSSAFGYINTANGSYSSAFGYGNTASGDNSSAGGLANNATNTSSTAFGRLNNAGGIGSVALGFSNNAYAATSVAIGRNVTNTTTGSLMIGPSDASKLTILSSGNVGIGTTSPYAKLSVAGDVVGDSFNATSSVGYKLGGTTLLTASSTGFNTFVGLGVGTSTTSGTNNTFVGYQSGQANTTGINNTANGYTALFANTTGRYNTANGYAALFSNTTGFYNTANGNSAMLANTTGAGNTAYGYATLLFNTTGLYNAANGHSALFSNTTGSYNTANGPYSLYSNTTGTSSTAIGYSAGRSNTTGSSNSFLGFNAGYTDGTTATLATLTNATAIGYNAQVTASNSFILGGTGAYGVNVGIGTTTPNAKLNVYSALTVDGQIGGLSTDLDGTNLPGGNVYGNKTTLTLPFSTPATNVYLNNTSVTGECIGCGNTSMFGSYVSFKDASANTKMYGFYADSAGSYWGTNSFFANLSDKSTGYIASSTSGYTGNFLDFKKGGVSQLVVNGNGNVGIGTTSPYAKLSVVGGVVADAFNAVSTTATSTFAGNISTNGEYRWQGKTVFTTDGNGGAIGLNNSYLSSGFAVGTGNAAGDALASAIGTNNIASALLTSAIGYNNTASGINAVALGYINSATSTSANAMGNDNKAGGFQSVAMGYSNGAYASNAIAIGAGVINTTASSLMIGPSDASKLTILSGGNVGIGTTSPYAKLSVVGNVVADAFNAVSSTATSTFANHISIASGKEYRIGGVGILTKDSTGSIILGDILGNTRGGGAAALDLQSTRSVVTQVASGYEAVAVGSYNTSASLQSVAVGYANSVTSNFSTAFGLSNTISGAPNAGVFGKNNTVSAPNAFAFGAGITNTTADSLMIGPSDAAKLTILSSGNVGIGTSTPNAKLNLYNTLTTSDQIGGLSTDLKFSSTAGGSDYGNKTTLNIASNAYSAGSSVYANHTSVTGSCFACGFLNTYGSYVSFVNSMTNGNKYAYYADSAGSGYAVSSFFANLNDSSIGYIASSTSSFTGKFLEFNKGGVSQLVVDSNGNVGIGSSTPGYKLAVAGSVYASSFIDDGITISAPDYVFDDQNYIILSIEEIRSYVAENYHLPWLTPRGAGAMSLSVRINEILEGLENLYLKVFDLVDWNKEQDTQLTQQGDEISTLKDENELLRNRLDQIEAELNIETSTTDVSTVSSSNATTTATSTSSTATTTDSIADTIPPVVTLLGDATMTVDQGATYTDAGATASDDVDVDGDVTAEIVTVGTVDTATAGVYIITYNVTDTAGNKATEVTRTVEVVAPDTPDNASTTISS